MIKLNNLKKLKNSKKGEFFVVDFWAIVVFILIFIIFLILFLSTKTNLNKGISEEFNSTESSSILVNLIRTPVEFEGKQMTFGDLIILYDSTKNETYKLKMTKEFNTIMSKLDTSKCYESWIGDYPLGCSCTDTDSSSAEGVSKTFIYLINLNNKPFSVFLRVCNRSVLKK